MIRIGKLHRRALAAVLMAAIFLSIVPVGQAVSVSDFADVSKSAWYYDAVAYVTAKGLFTGMTATAFGPGGGMTRGMFITVLGRYAKVDPDAWLQGTVNGSGAVMRSAPSASSNTMATLRSGAVVTLQGQSGGWYKIRSGSLTGYVAKDSVTARYHSFTDVDYSAYYAGYAVWAFENKIVNGMGSASVFSPNTYVTREQLCSFLNRYASAAKLTLRQSQSASAFTDGSSISSWARTDVTAMQRCGVVQGNTKGAFQPRNSATRAEAATMFQRFDAAAAGAVLPTASPGPSASPVPSVSPAPSASPSPTPPLPTDPPATLVSGVVSVPATVIRVGLLVSTTRYDSCVQTVKLENTSGSGFAFGAMDSSRRFVSSQASTTSSVINIVTDGTTFTVTDQAGNAVYAGNGNLAIHPAGEGTGTRLNGEYRYYGDFELRQAYNKPGYITVINFVGIEDYVKGVIPYEFSVAWPAETLKAAAVASRTHIMSLVNSSAYSQYGMDLVDVDGTQLYRGRGITNSESHYAPTDAAVEATSGLYLTYGGSLCVAAFSACNGGMLKSSAEAFGVNYPYLIAKADPYEQAAVRDVNAISNYEKLVQASHRVGMSQWGAFAMGKYYGKDYQTILGFYYPGTHLQYGDY